jgi:hypothetical protein
MEDGVLEGMQSFDHELERLINTGVIEREVGLSYATNRTNLQLRLDTQGAGAEEKKAAPRPGATPAHGVRRVTNPPALDGGFDDLIER